jgi:hypothetical protein
MKNRSYFNLTCGVIFVIRDSFQTEFGEGLIIQRPSRNLIANEEAIDHPKIICQDVQLNPFQARMLKQHSTMILKSNPTRHRKVAVRVKSGEVEYIPPLELRKIAWRDPKTGEFFRKKETWGISHDLFYDAYHNRVPQIVKEWGNSEQKMDTTALHNNMLAFKLYYANIAQNSKEELFFKF